MNRSQRPKRNVSSKSSVANEWKRGEEAFSRTPSPMKRKTSSRRDTKMGLKKISGKASPKSDRRVSLILKRLEIDSSNSPYREITSRRQTRRQSMASIPKVESKMAKKQIPRAKSEKIIAKNKTSTSSVLPTVKIEKLKFTNIETKPRHSEASKKPLSKTREATSISKDSFYSKSPVKTRQMRKSMVKISESKTSSSILKSPKTSRTDVKHKIKSEFKIEALPSREKSLPYKSEVIIRSETSQKKLPQRNTKPEEKAEKAKTPLRKPVKRLSNMTPSPMPLKTKRLTRSCAKKRVKILADSPTMNADYRKTPKSGNKISYRETLLSSEKTSGILKPYTPKPEEPLKILKQALKRNVASEMRNCLQTDISDFVRPNIVSARNPLKSTVSSPAAAAAAAYSEESNRSPKRFLTTESPIKNGIHHHQEESYSKSFQTPSTPVSSRKSVSFRRFRGSVRLIDDEPLKKNDDASECDISLKNPLNSTPVRFGKRNEDYHISDDHETSLDLSEVSSTHEESKCSVSSSYITHDKSYSSRHMEESSSEVSIEESEQMESKEQQTNKRRYCTLM